MGLRVVQELQGLAGEPVHRARCVGFAGGDDEHPGHVVGAVPVFAAGYRHAGVLEGGAMVRHAQQVREHRTGRGPGHATAERAGDEPLRELDVGLATTARPWPEPGRGPRWPWSRRRADRSAAGTAQSTRASGSSWATTVPAPLRQELDGVRERGGDDGSAAGDGVDQDAGGDLVLRVVGQHDDGGGLDELR